MRLLDLGCCAGCASDGYAAAGYDVTGVDIAPQPHYPYRFVQADAIGYAREHAHEYDAVHASMPCHDHSTLAKRTGPDGTAWLLGAVRDALRPAIALGIPVVLENVPGAPMRCDVLLCGTMFPGLRVRRHRWFEVYNAVVPQPVHPRRHPLTHTRDRRKAHYGRTDEWRDFVQVTGGGNCSVAAARDAMGVERLLTKYELNQGLPPAYTFFIGTALRG